MVVLTMRRHNSTFMWKIGDNKLMIVGLIRVITRGITTLDIRVSYYFLKLAHPNSSGGEI